MGCSYVPALGAVQRWFTRRRGVASGLAVSGIGIGTLVMPPLASHLVATVRWRDAYLALGTFTVVAGGGMALFLEDDPRRRGLGPDGESPLAGPADAPRAGATVAEAVHSRRFAGLYAACLLCSFGLFVPFVHLVPYAVDRGVPRSSAALLGVGSTAGRFLLGDVADRVGRRVAVSATLAGMAAALALWACSSGLAPLVAFALLYGAFYGGFVALLPALVMDEFGARSVSGIIGVLYTSVAVATLVGPSAAGFAFDASHGYALPILASAGADVVAAALLTVTSRAPAPRRRP